MTRDELKDAARAAIVSQAPGLAVGIAAGMIAWVAMPAGVPPLAQFAILALLPVVLGTVVAVALVPGPVRRAYEAFSWLGHRELVRFRATTGSSIPVGAEAVRDWLVANPWILERR